jgi:hypothetical protein
VSGIRIPADEVQFHPNSYCDKGGRLFTWRGGLYRALTPRGVASTRELFGGGLADRLIETGLLIETEQTDYELDGYERVLRHKYLPFVSFPFEWSFEQLRDVALLVADLELEVTKAGLTVFDSDPWNVLFDGPRPAYIDVCSILKDEIYAGMQWPGLADYTQKLVYPLHLMAAGHEHVARWLLHDRHDGVLKSEFGALAGRRGIPRRLRRGASDFLARMELRFSRRLAPAARLSRSRAARLRLLRELRAEVEAIPTPARHAEVADSLSPPASAPVREAVNALFVENRPKSILHLLREGAWCPILSARLGIPTVTLMSDERATASLYEEARREGLPLLPLNVDLENPSPGLGIVNKQLPAADQRLRSEMVVAVDVVPGLVDEHSLRWDQVATTFAAFTDRLLLVNLPRTAESSLQDLSGALSREFRQVSVQDVDSTFLVTCER